VLTVALGLGVSAAALAAPAHAEDVVTYEIVSDTIPVVDVEYVDNSGRRHLTAVPLPWRMDVALEDAQWPSGRGAQLRADWRGIRGPARWVTVRIFEGSKLLCQSTLDVGNIACYGNTPHVA
jgi:hypothetical protein